jgi:hypothetical protein
MKDLSEYFSREGKRIPLVHLVTFVLILAGVTSALGQRPLQEIDAELKKVETDLQATEQGRPGVVDLVDRVKEGKVIFLSIAGTVVPVNPDQFSNFLAMSLISGKITRDQLNSLIAQIATERRAALKAMDQYRSDYEAEIDNLRKRRSTLIKEREVALGRLSGDGCKLAGNWEQSTPTIGTTTWQIAADGAAKEVGIGYAKGRASLSGKTLTINWSTDTGYTGDYVWTLNEGCTAGEGSLIFKKPRTDRLKSSVKRT